MRTPSVRLAGLVAGSAASILLLASCGSPHPPGAHDAMATMDPVDVRTARVRGAGAAAVEVPGTVEAARMADVASRIAALIERMPVEEGDRVRRGQVVARLDGRDLAAAVAAAEAALRASRAQRDRIQALFAKEAATRQELDAAESQDAAAEAALAAAKAQIDYVDLRAPFDGWVVRRHALPGDLAAPGRPLVTLQGAGLMRVAATVSEDQAARVAVGRTVQVVIEDGRVVEAVVSIVNPASDPASRRSVVKADLPADAAARAGSFARLRLPAGREGEEEPIVPAAAIVRRGALTGVYVVEGGRARLRWLSPGETRGDFVVVRAGVSAGEEVVIGPSGLVDGAPVRATPADPAP